MLIFSSVYGVVDGFFVSNFAGKTSFAAVNLIMPFLMILSTVGFMFGTGGSALVAKTFGEGDARRANELFSLFTYVAFGLGVVIATLGIVFLRPISIRLGASGRLLEDCVIYGTVILCALPFFILQMLFQSFFVTAERPNLGFAVTLASGLTNMALDALLVILLPAQYKLIGAALASAASQAVGGILPLVYFFRKNTSILRLGRARLDLKAVARACINGSSEFMTNVSMSLVGMLYNAQLYKYAGENGIAAYGVMMYVSMIFSGAFIGYSVGSAPIIGFHDGARNTAELKSILNKSLTLIAVFCLLMTALAEGCAGLLARIFVGYDAELMALTERGFRIYALSFLLMGFAIFGSGFFTALNDGLTSALISFLRTLVFQLAAVLVLPLLWELNGVWISIVVAECMAFLLTVLFLKIRQKRYGY
ncbi:MAG: MATE family efflux transporter [Clostridia bacterium]|nr:MATE family efflux transporter [Clostridia bacterium]